MRIRMLSVIVGGALLVPTAARAQAGEKTMTVFVAAAAVADVGKVDKATETRLRDAIKAAHQTRKDREKTLKAQHGKKRETWPPEAEDQMYDAEEAEALAEADWAYRKVKQGGLSDTAEDIRKSIVGDGVAGRKDHIALVTSAAEAQLIVEVNGRRSGSSGTQPGLMVMRDDLFWISFAVRPGPRLPAERFAAVPRTYRLRRFGYQAWRLATPRPEHPEWRFEAHGLQRWGSAANVASVLVEDFIGRNYDTMLSPLAAK
jgi:hypothetical protein